LADLYFQAQQGKISLSEAYTVRRQDLVPGSDVLLGLTPDFTRLNLRDLASIMVAVSDNSAGNILIDRLGFENINAMLEGVELHTTRLKRKMMDLKAANEGRDKLSPGRARRIGGHKRDRSAYMELFRSCGTGFRSGPHSLSQVVRLRPALARLP
jgi:beta-lactamase class A